MLIYRELFIVSCNLRQLGELKVALIEVFNVGTLYISKCLKQLTNLEINNRGELVEINRYCR